VTRGASRVPGGDDGGNTRQVPAVTKQADAGDGSRGEGAQSGTLAMMEHAWRRAAVLLVLLALVALAAASDPMHAVAARVFAAMDHVISEHPRLGFVAFIALSASAAMVVFFSTAIFVPAAISAWGRPMTGLALWLGWLAGGVISFLIGRYPGRRLTRWLLPKEQVDRFEKLVSARASLPLIVLFQLALPSEVPGYVLGTVRYRLSKYLIALAVAELPFAIGAVYLGDAFMERDVVTLLAVGAGGVLFSLLAYAGFRRASAGVPFRSARPND
jgi:uncharacterized membrane protein YdjX (TVP38/TMEM64 family)